MHIDSEVHFWKYDRSNSNPLIRNNKLLAQHYLPEQLSQSLHRNGMQGCVAVTAENLEVESRFLAELAYTHPEILGVVGWTDLHDPHFEEKIKELQEYSPIKGFQYSPSNGPVPSASVMDLLQAHNYSLDLSLDSDTGICLIGKLDTQLSRSDIYTTRTAVIRMPVLLHQRIGKNKSANWRVMQTCPVRYPGLLTSAKGKSWKPADFYPFLDIVFDAFGPERLLFASDWPFLLAIRYLCTMEKSA